MVHVPATILNILGDLAGTTDRSPVQRPADGMVRAYPESALMRGLDIDPDQVQSIQVSGSKLIIQFKDGGRLEFALNEGTVAAFHAFATGHPAELLELLVRESQQPSREPGQHEDDLEEISTVARDGENESDLITTESVADPGAQVRYEIAPAPALQSGLGFGTPYEVGGIGSPVYPMSGLGDEGWSYIGDHSATGAPDDQPGAGGSATAAVATTATPVNNAPKAMAPTVTPVNDAPAAADDMVTLAEDGFATFDPLANDTDPDGDTLEVTGISGGAHGTATLDPDGTATYTPDPDFHGADALTYTVADGAGGSATAAVNLSISPVADVPNISANDASGNQDNAVPIVLSQEITDLAGLDGFQLIVTGVPAGARLSAGTANGDGSWTLAASELNNIHFVPGAGSSGGVELNLLATADSVRTLLDTGFDIDESGFTYADDAFRGTSEPGYADGGWGKKFGLGGGGLEVTLGGGDNSDVFGMSGGWSYTFVVDEASQGTLTFTYRLTMDNEYEPDEYSEMLVSVDGVLVGTAGNDYVDRINGGKGGGPDLTTGWQTITLDLGKLDPGGHTIALGGYNNKKTTSKELTSIEIDDVRVDLSESAAALQTFSIGEPGIPLDVTASLNDVDGSESLEIVLSGMPAGASLSAGNDNGDGTWTLSPDDLTDLRLTPPAGFKGEMNLTATAISTDGTDTSSSTADFTVSVAPVDLSPSAMPDVDYAYTGGQVTAGNVIDGTDSDADPRLQGLLEADYAGDGATIVRAVRDGGITYTLAPDGQTVNASDGSVDHTFDPSTGTLVFTTTGGGTASFVMTGANAGDYRYASASIATLPPGTGLAGEVYDVSQRLGSISQVQSIIDGGPPTATFDATRIDYGVGPNGISLSGFLGADAVSLSGAQSDPVDTMAFRLSGYIRLDAGTHDFAVRSDDGFRLRIADQTVTEFDGNRAARTSYGAVTVGEDGIYPVEIIYWENGGKQQLQVTSSVTGGQELTGDVLYQDNPLAGGSESLEYTIEDMDGDQSTGILSIVSSDPDAPFSQASLGDFDRDGDNEYIVADDAGSDHFLIFGPTDPDVVDTSTIGAATGGFKLDEIRFNDTFGVTTINKAPSAADFEEAAAHFRTANPASDESYVLSGHDQSGHTYFLGGPAGDDITGTAGDDVIMSGGGADRMTGGAGSDQFVLSSADLGGGDLITDFQTGPGGDALDLADVLVDFDLTVDDLADWVQLNQAGGDTQVRVNSGGTGNAAGFDDIATLEGLTGLNLDDLLQDDNLLLE